MSRLRSARRATAPLALATLLAFPAFAGAATQHVDVTTPVTCNGTLAGEEVSLRVVGEVPQRTAQGEFLEPLDLSMTVRHPRGSATPVGPPPHAFTPRLAGLDLQAAGEGGLNFHGTFAPEVATVGPDTWAVTHPDLDQLNPTFIGGTAAVRVLLTSVTTSYDLKAPGGVITNAVNWATCTPVGGPRVLATIANDGAVAAGPPALFVSSATPQNGIHSTKGGLLYLRGTNLKGVRTVTFGPHTVRVALNTGSTIYALVPPVTRSGTWPVTVSRADGTTSAPNPDVEVTIYQTGPEA